MEICKKQKKYRNGKEKREANLLYGKGRGRPRGVKNKFTGLKNEFLKVFQALQSDKDVSLLAFAKKHPRDFYAMVAKMVPTKIEDGGKAGRTIIVIGSNGGNAKIS